MKNILFLLLSLSIIAVSGCKKKAPLKDDPTADEIPQAEDKPVIAEKVLSADSTTLAGTWELRHRLGGMRTSDPNYLPGNGNIIKFAQQKREMYADGKLYESGNFTIKDSVVRINNNWSTHYVDFGNDGHQKRFIRLGEGKLVEFIAQIATDGAEMTYVKIEGAK